MKNQQVDRMPYMFAGPRPSTFKAWRKQGLSEEQQQNWHDFIGDEVRRIGGVGPGTIDSDPWPRFEVQILEEKDNKRTWINEFGITRIDAIIQPTEGFATRKYVEFPVKNLADFEKLKERYDPHSPERYGIGNNGDCWKNRIELCNNSERPVFIHLPGLYWAARDWCGFENLSIMFYDQPKLIHEMMEYWTWFLMELYGEPLSRIKIDFLTMDEDMAYKTASMISPDQMQEFMLPHYKKLYTFFKDKGVECFSMDSDGYNGQLLEVFYPDGIEAIWPMEIAANNDPEDYLREYPELFILGGIDKRELRFSREQLRAEIIKRFKTARKYGRFIPTIDHGIPPDIPLRNYLYMVELNKGLINGEDFDYEPPCVLEKELGEIEEMFDPVKATEEAYR